MAVKKEFRDVTVSDFYRSGKSVPMIRVNGLWLEELGFKVGDCVRIKCDNGQLVISLNEEKAQEKKSEKILLNLKNSFRKMNDKVDLIITYNMSYNVNELANKQRR